VELLGRYEDPLAHPAVAMYPQHTQLCTAVSAALAACNAAPTVEVGLNRAAVARSQTVDALPNGEHLDPKLMAKDARVAKEGLAAVVGVDIGPTDPHPVDTNQRLARAGIGWGRSVRQAEVARLIKDEC
jgi:hypothetical protein